MKIRVTNSGLAQNDFVKVYNRCFEDYDFCLMADDKNSFYFPFINEKERYSVEYGAIVPGLLAAIASVKYYTKEYAGNIIISTEK